jgi:hypothetical protein
VFDETGQDRAMAVDGGIDRIRVLHRTGRWCPGVRLGPVAAYDLRIDPEWLRPGETSAVDRCFLLPDEGIQLTRPSRYDGTTIDSWWYVDVVAVDETDNGLVVRDLYLDVMVPPSGHRFDVLDLDDLADALERGEIDLPTAATALRSAQRFLDRYLRDPALGAPERVGFPPPEVTALAAWPAFG